MKKNKLLFKDNLWDVDILSNMWKVIDGIGTKELGLNYYMPQIELITYDQMLDAYSSVGMPIMYSHWSFGKSFIMNERSYKAGEQGLAYEMIINSNPSVCYCLETNSATMQSLVLAHAACGHNHFFKNNYLFKEWTDADGILSYLKFAKNYIEMCSEKYGKDVVEELLDACHALQDYGVDTYKRGKKKTSEERFKEESARLQFIQENYSEELECYAGHYHDEKYKKVLRLLSEKFSWKTRYVNNQPQYLTAPREFPEENLLYFFEKRSQVLFTWEKEIVRIVRNIAQYFYPQRLTKVMNEGFATAIHYTIMNMLYDRGNISEGNILEFLHSHTSVCCQQPMSSINPYSLGFNIFMDLKRICLEPTDEDREWFPDIAGSKDWLALWKDCVANYRDESFVLQFLSPKVIRDMKLFNINYDSDRKGKEKYYVVSETHKTEDIVKLRQRLSKQYCLDYYRPNIQIDGFDEDNFELILFYNSFDEEQARALDADLEDSMESYIVRLWGHNFRLLK